MNTALWMLYFADVAESLSTVLTIMVVIGFVALAVWLVGCGVTRIDDLFESWALPPKRAYAAVATAALIACLIPSKNTFYAIAAANVGQKALNTQTGDKAVRALNAWLDRQIADDGGKGK
jgi:hypothetical protein